MGIGDWGLGIGDWGLGFFHPIKVSSWGSTRPENEPVCSFSAENGRKPRATKWDERSERSRRIYFSFFIDFAA